MGSSQIRQQIANAICRLRTERKLTQAEVARAIDVEPATISAWELGKSTPQSDKAWLLADFFGVSVAEVMGKVEVTTREIIAAPSSNEEE